MATIREKAAITSFGAMIMVAIVLNVVRAVRPDEPVKPEVPAVPFEDVQQVYIPPEVTPEPPPAEEFNLAVPFTSQAPTGKWDALHEDTCEEASLLMVRRFYEGTTVADLPAAEVEQELQAMVASQTARGYGPSITAEQFLTFAEQYSGYTGEIVQDPTAEELRAALRAGHPVIVPAAGRRLANPYFSGEGPLYHMLVLRGYTAAGFLVNEPGTRHGKGYFYPTKTLLGAIADWNGGDPEHGEKRVIILYPQGTTVDN